jgi:DNA invertase Pin-like site-specific DNA recombinase
MDVYYVYEWIDPETGNIFYVGKGKGKRAWNSHSGYRCGNKLKNILKKGYAIQEIVNIVKEGLSESVALSIEDSLIKKYKRIEDGGTLFNHALNGARISNKKKKQIDLAILNNVKFLYEQQKCSANSIGKVYGVNGGTILRWLKSVGVKIRANSLPKKHIHQHIFSVLEMYSCGNTASSIASHFNVDVSTVINLLKQNHQPVRSKRIIFSDDIIQDIIDSYKSGESSNIIAKRYDVACCTILRTLKEKSVAIRSNSDAQKSKKLLK